MGEGNLITMRTKKRKDERHLNVEGGTELGGHSVGGADKALKLLAMGSLL